jgi:hypothetical protein
MAEVKIEFVCSGTKEVGNHRKGVGSHQNIIDRN